MYLCNYTRSCIDKFRYKRLFFFSFFFFAPHASSFFFLFTRTRTHTRARALGVHGANLFSFRWTDLCTFYVQASLFFVEEYSKSIRSSKPMFFFFFSSLAFDLDISTGNKEKRDIYHNFFVLGIAVSWSKSLSKGEIEKKIIIIIIIDNNYNINNNNNNCITKR